MINKIKILTLVWKIIGVLLYRANRTILILPVAMELSGDAPDVSHFLQDSIMMKRKNKALSGA